MSDELGEQFENADAGAADTIPMQAGELRKGGHVMIKGHPCKVVEITTSKTGKHGHAKAHIIALEIFTGKKMEELCPTSHNISVPIVTKKDYMLMDVQEDGTISLLDEETGETKDD